MIHNPTTHKCDCVEDTSYVVALNSTANPNAIDYFIAIRNLNIDNLLGWKFSSQCFSCLDLFGFNSWSTSEFSDFFMEFMKPHFDNAQCYLRILNEERKNSSSGL